MDKLTREEIKAYLERIGIADIKAPTKSYLYELHKAHVKHISWQTIDIFAGKPAAIDYRDSISLILNGRSGYCFHLNGAFSLLLRSLGYKVNLHRAGVQPLGTEPRINGFHLGVTVTLTNDQLEDEIWIVDVGLGDMPFEPLPLLAGTYQQGPFIYKVVESSVAPNGWRLEHDPLASVAGVDYDPAIIKDLEPFKPNHEHYSRSAESPWHNVFIVKNRHETGSNELRGCIWIRREMNEIVKTEITNQTQWLDVLANRLGERLVNYTEEEKDELWKKVQRAHEEWKLSKVNQPSS
ncbi:arylamine N-acetyltransferase family protein [Paenibacillus sp. PL91]|uniref:arylamine N-acetyltransferase family protein n=1 Tax=Paenibacillus sp. PL91 TaxID=2729538 RepID=UPI00145E8E50|nr:arylamine N-acetyltransferase [Paenibacillus sp. PL91]MBC9200889.1 arylamine N-acetyltransferase [Paenibacillus sp. PL91]